MRFLRKKTVDKRFADTVAFIHDKAPPDVAGHVVNMIANTINKLPDPAGFVEALSLGSRFDIIGRDAETERRHYIRAVLLASGTLGEPDKGGRRLLLPEVETKKTQIRDLKRDQLAQMLADRLALLKATKGQNSFVGIASSLEKNRAFLAIGKVEEAVNRASMALMRCKYDPKEMARTRKWFGQLPSDTALGQELSAKYQRLYQRLRSGVEIIRDDDPDEDSTFAYVSTVPADNIPVPKIYLCGAFWRATTVEWSRSGQSWTRVDKEMRNDNPLGVIIHEMTHIVLGTEDHVYGKTECRTLASTNPRQARENADNFEYFSEAVMLNDYA
jgi:hypothetical protein